MKLIYKKDNHYILRFEPEEEFIETLIKFCEKEKIKAGWFEGIGACKKVELNTFDFKKQKYLSTAIKETFEILSLKGNIATANKKPVIHAHAVLGKKDLTTIGGHVNSLVIQGVCELYLETFNAEFKREGKGKGLKLLSPIK